jgi:hypothetical protein
VKKLVAGTVVIFAALVLLWWQMREPAAAVAPVQQRAVAATSAVLPAQTGLAAAAKHVAEAQANSGKLDPASDEFFYREEAIVPALTENAASCYTGGLSRVHRNAKVKLGFTIKIKDGVISATDVKTSKSSSRRSTTGSSKTASRAKSPRRRGSTRRCRTTSRRVRSW